MSTQRKRHEIGVSTQEDNGLIKEWGSERQQRPGPFFEHEETPPRQRCVGACAGIGKPAAQNQFSLTRLTTALAPSLRTLMFRVHHLNTICIRKGGQKLHRERIRGFPLPLLKRCWLARSTIRQSIRNRLNCMCRMIVEHCKGTRTPLLGPLGHNRCTGLVLQHTEVQRQSAHPHSQEKHKTQRIHTMVGVKCHARR